MMKPFVAVVFAFATCLSSLVLPAHAAPMKSPEGLWELEYKDSHYDVSLCGGEKLCVTLVWLSEGASTPEKTVYLNKPLVDHAVRVGDRTWRGELDLFGVHANGKVTQVSDDEIHLRGCAFLVACKTFKFYRLK